MPLTQVFFLLLFALFYSTMLASLYGHYVFSWQYLRKGKWRKTIPRIGLSYILFTGIPCVLFFLIFRSISSLSEESFWPYIYIIFASQTVFVPYRIYHFIDCKWRSLLYGSSDDDIYRPKGSQLEKHLSEDAIGHIYAILAMVGIPLIIWWFIH